MKKISAYFGIIAAAALTLVSCAKEINTPVVVEAPIQEGIPFEIVVNPQTKTSISGTPSAGLQTAWVANDAINLYHAEAGSTSYANDGKFTIASADLASGTFKGSLTSAPASGTYDWYAFYPYVASKASPASESAGWTPVGSKNNAAQAQTGNNSIAHLSGSNYPLSGKVTSLAYNATPSITLKSLCSFVEINVTNDSGAPLTVTNVNFTAPEDIIGTYYINITDPSNIVYVASDAGYVSETAGLAVSSGEAIPDGGSAKFYLGIKPFTLAQGSSVTVSVNGYNKVITATSKAYSFQAGKIKTVNVIYDAVPEPPQVYELIETDGAFVDDGKYVLALQDGATPSTYYFLTSAGTTNTLTTSGPSVSAKTITDPGAEFVFTAEADGTLFKLKNNGGKYICNTSSTTLNTNNNTASSWYPTFISASKTYKLQVTNSSGRYIGANAANSTKAAAYANRNFKDQVKDGTAIAQYSGAISVFKLGGLVVSSDPTINNASVDGAPVQGQSGLTKDIELANFDAAPSLTATPDNTVITAASVGSITTTSAKVTYTLSPNTSGAARVGTITVSDGVHSGTITVNQPADVFSVTRTEITLNANTGATASFTVKSDYDWTLVDDLIAGFTVSPASFAYNGNQSQTVTITATGDNSTASPVELGVFTLKRGIDNHETETITVIQSSAKLATPVITLTPDSANKKFTVSWTAVSNAAKYEYFVLDGSDNEKVAVTQTADASTLSFEVTDINYDEEYTVSVKAIGNNSPWMDSDESVDSITVTVGTSSEEIDLTAQGFANGDEITSVDGSVVSLLFAKGSGSNVPKYYTSGTSVRTYIGNTLTVSVSGGKTITKIEFTLGGTKTATVSASVGTLGTISGSSRTWTGSSSSVVFTNSGSGQMHYQVIKVTYE